MESVPSETWSNQFDRLRKISTVVLIISIIAAFSGGMLVGHLLATPAHQAEPPVALPNLLFVQTAPQAMFMADTARLVLTGVSPATVWFADRPARITGQTPTDQFVAGWSVGADSFAADPPNAALEFVAADGSPAVAIVELREPLYNPDTATLSYAITLVPEATNGLSHYQPETITTVLPEVVSDVALFIDNESSASASTLPGVGQFYGVDITVSGLSSDEIEPLSLFDFSADSTSEVTMNGDSYTVPGSLLYEDTDTFDSETHSYSSVEELSTSLSVDAGIKYESPTVQADVKSSYSQSESSASESYFTTIDAWDRKYRLIAESPEDVVSADFTRAVSSLPNSYTAASQDEYFDLFATYGTHFTYMIDYGGAIHYWSQESDTQSTSLEEFELSVSGQVDEISGSVDVTTSESSSESTSDVVISISGSGGDASKLSVYESSSDAQHFDDWWATIPDNPGKINVIYKPIYELITDTSKANEVASALDDYLTTDLQYEITFTSTNHSVYSMDVDYGNSDENIQSVSYPDNGTEQLIGYGGILIALDADTGALVDKKVVELTADQAHDFSKKDKNHKPSYLRSWLGATTLETFNSHIESLEQAGEDNIYLIAMTHYFEDSDITSYSWFEKIGAPTFDGGTFDTDGTRTSYFLVGRSDLGADNGSVLVHKSHHSHGDASFKISAFTCEFEGTVGKDLDGFSDFITPSTAVCQ